MFSLVRLFSKNGLRRFFLGHAADDLTGKGICQWGSNPACLEDRDLPKLSLSLLNIGGPLKWLIRLDLQKKAFPPKPKFAGFQPRYLLLQREKVLARQNCLFSPLQGPESVRGGNPRKMGKNYKIPLPGPTPENGEKLPKNYKICIFGVIFPLFGANFPHFRGLDRGRGIL